MAGMPGALGQHEVLGHIGCDLRRGAMRPQNFPSQRFTGLNENMWHRFSLPLSCNPSKAQQVSPNTSNRAAAARVMTHPVSMKPRTSNVSGL